MERRAYLITGQVQGVGFRWHVRQAAGRLALRGWVRNRPDGSVEVEAEGSPEALDRLESALREGPPAAVVREVERRPASEADLSDGFEIRR